MRDDDRNVSARGWRAVREGDTHAATKTSTNNTPESFIVGVGASGALLAGAAIVFVTLVGLVSFNVWPTAHEVSVDGNVELSTAKAGAPSGGSAAAPVSAAAGQLASTSVGGGSGANGPTGGGGNDQGAGSDQGGGNGGRPKSRVEQPPATVPTAPPTEGSDVPGNGGGADKSPPGTASKDPAHEVHPAHPDKPHQNVSTGTNGKEDDSPGNSGQVHGKGHLTKPTSPSSSASEPDKAPKSRGSSSHGSSSHGSSSHGSSSRGSSHSKH